MIGPMATDEQPGEDDGEDAVDATSAGADAADNDAITGIPIEELPLVDA